jgi:ribosomal protein S18 acetylase RimI-like enzyme
MAFPQDRRVFTRRVKDLTIRPLRHGDRATVEALFARLGPASRVQRFGGAKPRLTDGDLALLTRVDETHHTLVAYVDGDPAPAGLAQLVRDGDAAEIAFAVADEHQRRGIGSVLVALLADDARAAGITHLHATVRDSNGGALALVTRCARLVEERFAAGEREIVVAL